MHRGSSAQHAMEGACRHPRDLPCQPSEWCRTLSTRAWIEERSHRKFYPFWHQSNYLMFWSFNFLGYPSSSTTFSEPFPSDVSNLQGNWTSCFSHILQRRRGSSKLVLGDLEIENLLQHTCSIHTQTGGWEIKSSWPRIGKLRRCWLRWCLSCCNSTATAVFF